MTFDTPQELIDHWEDKRDRWEEEVEHLSEVVRYLEVAHDYLEDVIGDADDGDLLPSSTSRQVEDLVDRQMQISDRLSYRSDALADVKGKLDRWEEDRDWEMDGHGFDVDGETV